MTEIPHATVKDLLSTGYFFDALKGYSKTAEIDLSTYNKDFVVPYLSTILKSYERSGQPDRSVILTTAIQNLSEADDDNMVGYILDLRKMAASEVDANEKALVQNIPLDKSERLTCRKKSESAQSLTKLFVSIIRAFKLTEVNVKRDKTKRMGDSLSETMSSGPELAALPVI